MQEISLLAVNSPEFGPLLVFIEMENDIEVSGITRCKAWSEDSVTPNSLVLGGRCLRFGLLDQNLCCLKYAA